MFHESSTAITALGRRPTRRRSWLLLLALLPMLTYFGHWPGVVVEVPAMDGYWQLPFTGDHHTAAASAEAHNHGNHSHGDTAPAPSGESATTAEAHGDHSQHCHTDMGSCLNTTAASFVAFALLAAAVAFFGLADIARACTASAWAPVRQFATTPEAPPPQPLLVT